MCGLKIFVGMMALSLTAMSQEVLREDLKPEQTMAVLFTPVVIPDIISFKAAFEYRLHKNFNLVVPLEFKYMNYDWIFGSLIDEEELAKQPVRLRWSHDLRQLKLSSGIGLKWIPFTSSMASGFFVKSLIMGGYEFQRDSRQQSTGAVFTHALLVGYTWIMKGRFLMAVEGGEEYTWHTDPIRGFPDLLLNGLMPVLHLSLGFTF